MKSKKEMLKIIACCSWNVHHERFFFFGGGGEERKIYSIFGSSGHSGVEGCHHFTSSNKGMHELQKIRT